MINIKKITGIILSCCLISAAAGCTNGNNTGSESMSNSKDSGNIQAAYEDEQDDNLFKDRKHLTGFKLSNTSGTPGPTYIGNLHYGELGEDVTPRWILAQWTTKYLIQPTDVPEVTDGSYVFKNESKEVRVNTDDGTVYLECNASKEYDQPRKSMEEWPHLLIEQYMQERNPDLSKIKSMRLKMEFSIDKCEKKMTAEEFDAGLHTAQFQINFTLGNLNKQSEDYNDGIWFGLSLYDNRYSMTNDSLFVDGGKESATGLVIYGIGSKKLLGEPVWIGDRIYVDFDILPEIKNALKVLKEYEDVQVFRNTELSDLKFTTMNLGWELPGTYDVASTIYSLDLVWDY